MGAAGVDGAGDGGRRGALRRALDVRAWPLWGLPARLLVAVLTVEFVTVVLVGVGIADRGLSSDGLFRFGAVVVLGILHNEAARGIERVRRRVGTGVHVDMSSVWFFAAVVLLPPAWAGLTAIVVHGHLWIRANRPRVPLFKEIFNACNMALSGVAAGAVLGAFVAGDPLAGGAAGVEPVAVVIAVLVWFTVNSALAGGVIAMHAPESTAVDIVGDWQENLLEIATLCMGALTALAILVNPWLVLFVLPTLLVMHRAVLVQHLEEAASRDGKTGLLNAAAWHNRAERELRKAERRDDPRGVLVIDLDHFKHVNDTYGHLAGDHVLAAVAAAVDDEVRDRDVVGRFGGEEFVVMLGGVGEACDRGPVAQSRVEADGPVQKTS